MGINQKKCITIRVHGKVQGVFFRASTQEKAQELGLTGFVRNETDGTVYLEAEGDTTSLQHLEAWVRHGPRRAQVEKVEIQELNGLKGYEKFEQQR